MQIGEFAKLCHTRISVLRHYDKEGLLVPDYIDRFSGYRYYSNEQIRTFAQISALKKAGFSLPEIKRILSENKNSEEILALFEKKKHELQETLQNLKEAETMMIGYAPNIKVRFIENDKGIFARTAKIDGNDFNRTREILDESVISQGYQRVSGFTSYGEPLSNEMEICCAVVKLAERETWPHEDIDFPFEDDPSVVGKWEIIGEYAVKEDFFAEYPLANEKSDITSIYFLPDGKRYWCFGWTKGKLLIENGDGATANNFTVESHDGKRYMFVDFKSYHYRHGGKTTVLVLRQSDNHSYTADEIARKDDIDREFIPDERISGKWKAVDYCRAKEAFDPERPSEHTLFFTEVEFKPDGEIISNYNGGKTVASSRDLQEWTRGFILNKRYKTACAYDLQTINGMEYLFIEWKSGDYIWGGFDPTYYVFVRE